MTSPTFDGYPIFAQMARLESVTVPLDAHGHHDLDAMADAAADARVVVVCRPHNPTGTVEPAADIERFLRRVPSDTVVLLDEAYVEFVAPEHRIDAPALVERFPNVVVLRTFSKAYGLAGLRIGYGFCAPELARTLWTMQLPFGIGITSLVAVAASYDAESQLQQRIRLITAERRYLRMRLRAMGVYSTDSHANFVYLPPARRPWREVFDGTGLQVRHYADGGVRITVGNRQSTRAVLAAVAPIARAENRPHRRVQCGMKRRGLRTARPDKRDPIALARANWERAGWGDVADGMVAVTSVMRAHQILLARVETALRPYDLSFSRYELLRLLAFSRNGALPITKASDRLQVHVTSVTHAIRRLEADGLVRAHPASHRRPHHAGADHRTRPLDGRGRHRHAQQARCSPTSACPTTSRGRWRRRSRRCAATPATSTPGRNPD